MKTNSRSNGLGFYFLAVVMHILFFFFFFQGPWPTAKASLLTIKVEIRNTYSHVDNQSSDHKLHIHKL